jgi:hypothetical protein
VIKERKMNLNDVLTPTEIEGDFGLGAGTVRQYLNNHADELKGKARKSGGTWLVSRDAAIELWGFEVVSIDVIPDLDAHNRQMGGITKTVLNIYPQEKQVSVVQEDNTSGTWSEFWHNHAFAISMDGYALEGEIRDFIRDNQGKLRTIAQGHSIGWDGSNMVGELSEDANQALDEIIEAWESLGDVTTYMIMDADDYIQMLSADELRNFGNTAEAIAQAIYDNRDDNDVILGGLDELMEAVTNTLDQNVEG